MSDEQIIRVPDIGGASKVDVIEILVKNGDVITLDMPLVTLESDKASMEIPSPSAGVVKTLQLKLGDKVSEGDPILILVAEQNSADVSTTTEANVTDNDTPTQQKSEMQQSENELSKSDVLSAGPGARRLARELEVNLAEVTGTGRKARISNDDVLQFAQSRAANSAPASGALSITPAPAIDFSRFGAVEIKPLNKIKRFTGINLHRSWVTVPHVTQFDEADITELEAFRKAEVAHADSAGYKLTILAFVCKIVSKALLTFPQFNASLDATGENLIYKKYVNIGIAVDTPNGLVVPVLRDVNTLSVVEIAVEMARLSAKARDKNGLTPVDLSGGCFTISSLGGIGGTAFTPIVNSPEVAILGLSRSSIKPVYIDGQFKPRLMLPLSLSYDHRVIDGADGARFTRFIADSLSDIRRILL